MGESSAFEGGDKAIADEVRREIAVAYGKVIDVDSDDDDDDADDAHSLITRTDLFDLCQRVEAGCVQYGDPQFSLNLSVQLRIFRGTLRREELMTAKQTSLDQIFSV
jgi:hypothetical protein